MAIARRLEMTRISVIVPVHNAAAWLDDCLDALVSQDFPRGGTCSLLQARRVGGPPIGQIHPQTHALGGENPGR